MSGGEVASSSSLREILPKKGLLFTETQSQMVLCKPKLLPLKSFTLQKLEAMQNEAKLKAQAQLRPTEDFENNDEDERRLAADGAAFISESVSFE